MANASRTSPDQRRRNDTSNDERSDDEDDTIDDDEVDDEDEEEDDVNVDDDVNVGQTSSNSDEKVDKIDVNSSTRNKPSIFSVSSLLSDEKTTRKEDRLVDEKEEDEITLPSTLHQQAFGKPSFFYPGMTRVFKWAIPAPYFDYFNLLTVNSKYVKDNFWLIQPKDLWYRKLRQLSHSHYPWDKSFSFC